MFTLINCDKSEQPDNNEVIDSSHIYKLEIKRNRNSYRDYIFSETEILEERLYWQDSRAKRINYKWNTCKLIQTKIYYDDTGFNYWIDSIFYDENKRIDYIIPYWYTDYCQCLYNTNQYYILEYDDYNRLIQLIDYDSTYNNYLTLTFEYYAEQNVFRKYYPLNTGMPQYSYEYDDKNSYYQLINLPKIDEIAISNNNITKVHVKQQSLTWDEITEEPIYTVDESDLYTSTFIYDSLNYPIKELRYSNQGIDTFEYNLILIE